MKKHLLIVVSSLLTIISAAQQPRYASYLDTFLRKNNFNGNLIVQVPDQPLYQKSVGLANMEHKVPTTVNTKYRIASLTKLFTAVLIMQLHEETKLDLNATIGQYLPTYKGEGLDKVTIHQLLNHTSGISNMDTVKSLESALQNGVPVYQQPLTSDQLLARYASGPLVATPGSTFDYNNADYVILGKIIEQLRGQRFDSVLHQYILLPLGMTNSGMAYQQRIIPALASNYFYLDDIKQLVPDLPFYNENWYAAGSMYATATDILKFSNALFGKKLLTQSSLDKMFVSGKEEYGYGVWVYEKYEINKKMYTIIKRPGFIMGAQTMLFHILEANTTIIILCNTGTVSLDGLAASIAKRIDMP